MLAGGVLSVWPNIVIHEAGHALAGVARGMHAIAFGVGPLRCERGGDGRWRWRNGGGIRGIGGFAALLPQGGRGLSRVGQMLFLSGGPLANLLATAVLAALLAWLAGTLIGAAPGAATLGLGTLVPLHVQGWRSGGRGLLDLARCTPDAALQVQINQRMALSHVGVRPRDWPASAMPADDGAAASAGLRLSRAIDARDADGARADALALADAFAGAPAIFHGVIAVALASHAALLVGDRALVAAWRRRCEGGLMDLSPYRTWLDAEIARLDGDAATCAAHLERACGLIDRLPDAASRQVLDARLSELGRG